MLHQEIIDLTISDDEEEFFTAVEGGADDQEALPHTNKKALLLGMVFSDEQSPRRGQEYRDRVRCEALERLGYDVYTLDDKHDEGSISSGRHCCANFAVERRMMKSVAAKWGEDIVFDDIILDYFFSPVGWARTRWSQTLFTGTLPSIAKNGLLKKGGKVLLPNLSYTDEALKEFEHLLEPYYNITTINDPKENVLYLATESVTADLLKCPDNITNETQIKPLLNHSENPFYVLQLRQDVGTPVSAPTSPRDDSDNIDYFQDDKRIQEECFTEPAIGGYNESVSVASEVKEKKRKWKSLLIMKRNNENK